MGNPVEKTLSIGLLYYPVFSLGPGRRTGIWVQGCRFRCEGCVAVYSWDIKKGRRVDVEDIVSFIFQKSGSTSEGVTISGGEPFLQAEGLHELINRLWNNGIYDIMVYTGYSYSHLRRKYPEILDKIAALVSGRFVSGLDTRSVWKGSENQKLHILTRDGTLNRRYREYRKETTDKRTLQIAESERKIFVIGIPEQKDAEVLNNGFCKDLPDVQHG